MMRLINNFAAITFGEMKSTPSAERLHYIEGVDGDLWYEKDGFIYQLNVKGKNVKLYQFALDDKGRGKTLIHSSKKKRNTFHNIYAPLSDDALKEIYDYFFYTIVTNYSIYAYNTRDFEDEDDSIEKVKTVNNRIRESKESENRYYDHSRNWLDGVFHKNDGYQIPLVLTPCREEGNIDINTENSLAKERLMALMVQNKKFRIINGHLKAESLSISRNLSKDYGFDTIRNQFEMKNLTEDGYGKLRRQIAVRWSEIIGAKNFIEDTKLQSKPYYNLALDYLAYKTLKVAATYRQHNAPFLQLRGFEDGYNEMLVNEIVESEAYDWSHTTRKIFQTLAYLMGDFYSARIKAGETYTLNFDEIQEPFVENYAKIVSWDDKQFMVKSHVAELASIPPPFLNSRINLCEKTDEKQKISFESLSSGERQIAYTVSSILYHLDNLNSVKADGSDTMRIHYENLFLVLEEVELYFHPELQQGLIKNILEGISQLILGNVKGIHILFVTHSPYVLSDIPKQNVLALENDGRPSVRKLNTFCANIHEMLEDSFFLSDGSQGYFAQWEVGRLMACIRIHQRYKYDGKRYISMGDLMAGDEDKGEETKSLYMDLIERYEDSVKKRKNKKLDYIKFCCDFSIEQIKQKIALIDEPVIRAVLEHELNTVIASDNDMRLARIEELEAEVRRLKEMK